MEDRVSTLESEVEDLDQAIDNLPKGTSSPTTVTTVPAKEQSVSRVNTTTTLPKSTTSTKKELPWVNAQKQTPNKVATTPKVSNTSSSSTTSQNTHQQPTSSSSYTITQPSIATTHSTTVLGATSAYPWVIANNQQSTTINTTSATTALPAKVYTIYFDANSAKINAAELSKLQTISQQPVVSNIQLSGYADKIGNASHNMALSKKRAEAIKAQLIQLGMTATTINIQYYGDTLAPKIGTDPMERKVTVEVK